MAPYPPRPARPKYTPTHPPSATQMRCRLSSCWCCSRWEPPPCAPPRRLWWIRCLQVASGGRRMGEGQQGAISGAGVPGAWWLVRHGPAGVPSVLAHGPTFGCMHSTSLLGARADACDRARAQASASPPPARRPHAAAPHSRVRCAVPVPCRRQQQQPQAQAQQQQQAGQQHAEGAGGGGGGGGRWRPEGGGRGPARDRAACVYGVRLGTDSDLSLRGAGGAKDKPATW